MTTDTNGEATEVEAQVGNTKLRAKSRYMAELVSLSMTAAFVAMAFMFYHHDKRANEMFTEMVETNKRMVQSQREMNCLISIPQDRRESDYQTGFCKRMSQ